MVMSSACRTDSASSTSSEPATAPEEAPVAMATSARDYLTYVPGERFGKLTGTTQEGDLAFLYGEQVENIEVYLGEGITVPGYRLFPGTAKEADVVFPNEETGFNGITVIVNREDTEWLMPNSPLTIGTPLAELEKLNGKPFGFLGYEWDYSGVIFNWNDGQLNALGGTLSLPQIAAGKGMPEELMGDVEVSSDSPLLEGMGIFLREIIVDVAFPVIGEDGIPSETDFAIVPGHRFGAMPASLEPGDLELTYGVGNVEPMDYDLDGGVSVPGFRLFAGTKNEVEIGFPDEDKYLKGVEFRISKENSDWYIAGTNLRVGDDLAEVRMENGKPFLIYSHNMEGGGMVTSWKGGRLAGTDLYFDTVKAGKNYKYDEEHNVSSDAAEVVASDVKVSMIKVYLKR